MLSVEELLRDDRREAAEEVTAAIDDNHLCLRGRNEVSRRIPSRGEWMEKIELDLRGGTGRYGRRDARDTRYTAANACVPCVCCAARVKGVESSTQTPRRRSFRGFIDGARALVDGAQGFAPGDRHREASATLAVSRHQARLVVTWSYRFIHVDLLTRRVGRAVSKGQQRRRRRHLGHIASQKLVSFSLRCLVYPSF